MDLNTLYGVYLGISRLYLIANSSYLKNLQAHDKNSLLRQKDILDTVSINLNAIKTYIDSFPESSELIEDGEVNESINECVKLLKIFKTYYNER